MNIEFSTIEEEDLEFINSIRNDDSTRKYLRNTSIISLDETKSWFKLERPKWFIITVDNEKIGYIRTSQETEDSICVGCDIAREKRGLGLSKIVYRKLLDELHEKYKLIWLEVFEENIIALNLYKKLNFIEVNSYKTKDDRVAIIMVYKKNDN